MTRSAIRREERGQVLALSCVLLFVMAMTMMLSFNLAQGIHEKIRLQSQSDAVAYSVAVVEARSFNYHAYTNRAIAADLVGQMGIHGWMSTVSAAAATHEAGAMAFGIIAALEFIEAGFCPYPCCVFIHCEHAIEAGIIAIKMLGEAMDLGNKAKDLDGKFNDAVEAFKKMNDQLHKDQRAALDSAKSAIESVPGKIRDWNAKKSTEVSALNDKNVGNFACALEGSNFDDKCTDSNRTKSSLDDRSIVMENSANSARTIYHRTLFVVGSGGMGADAYEDYRSGSDHLKDDQNNEGDPQVLRFGNAHVGEGDDFTSDKGKKADSVGASQMVSYIVPMWHDAPGAGVSMAKIFSDKNGGTHWAGALTTDTDHDKYKGMEDADPCGDDNNCFINFRADSKKEDDFGQPSAYGASNQNLRLRPNADKAKWEVNDSATIGLELKKGDPISLKLAARKDALAVSKAKAYFHQPGNWQAPPNFFDPFWRAKLHPFKREELKSLLNDFGASDDSTMAGNLPVEGDTR